MLAYGNSIGQACSLSTSVTRREDGSENLLLMLFTPGHWIDVSPGQPRLRIMGKRHPDKGLSVRFDVNPDVFLSNPNYEDIQRRKEEGMFGRVFHLQIDDSGTRTWYGNKSGVEVGLADNKAGVRLKRLFDEMLRRAGLAEENKGDSR